MPTVRTTELLTKRLVKVAFVGKGGSGKSTIAGTFARLLARRGESVLALDSDPLPGLSYALGIGTDDTPIPDDVVVEGPEDGPRFVLAPNLDSATIIERYATRCPDNVHHFQFGNTSGDFSAIQRAQFAWKQTVAGADTDTWNLVGDLPGGTKQAMFGWGKYADCVLLVVEPTVKSLHSTRRLLRLADAEWAPTTLGIVANKVRTEADVALISARFDRPVMAAVPLSPSVIDGDRNGQAPLDADPDGAFVAAVDGLVDQVRALYDVEVKEPTDGVEAKVRT